MNVHHKASPAVFRPEAARGVHPLDHINGYSLCDGVTVFTPTAEQIAQLMDRARRDLAVPLAANEVVQRVAAANPDAFWAVARRAPGSEALAEPRGLVAMLLLNEEGMNGLLRGTLDRRNPPREVLVGQHERPAGIYGWLIHTKGRLAPGLTLVMEKLQAPLYRGVDIVCRASSKDGAAFFDALGFSDGLWWDGEFRSDFRHYRRTHDGAGPSAIEHRLRPPYDSFVKTDRPAQTPTVSTRLVRNPDDLDKAKAIRAAVYIEEQDCPFEEEFDGNDYTGTHHLAFWGSEPVGCLRIRYFGDHAKIERVAVLRRFRHRHVATQLVRAALEFCRSKGYRRTLAHARRTLLPFWTELGFSEHADQAPFVFSDHEYVAVVRDLDPLASAIDVKASPYVLIRPEGQWDRPGILELSAARGVAAGASNQ